jgi:Domain of unknown function (DUF4249)
MKFLLNIGFISLLFCSCSGFFDQVIDIDPPKYEPKMVVNCIASNFDSVLKISISRNVGLLENIPDSANNLANATVEWFENGVLKYTFTRDTVDKSPFSGGNGVFFKYYGADLNQNYISGGNKYEIRVKHPNYPSVSGTQIAPKIIQLDTVKVKLDTTNNGGFVFGDAIFSMTFQDPPGEANFYQISMRGDDNNGYYGFESDDPNVVSGIGYDKLLLSDKNFDGQKYTLRFKTGDVTSESYKIIFSACTKEFFQFSKAVPQNQDAEFNPFASPVQIPTNIDGGLGLFGLFGTYEIIVKP